MYNSIYQGVEFLSNKEIDLAQKQMFLHHVQQKYKNQNIQSIHLNFHENQVDIDADIVPMGFEHLRRITGYLVGTLDKFNNGKRAEERDRVKHLTKENYASC